MRFPAWNQIASCHTFLHGMFKMNVKKIAFFFQIDKKKSEYTCFLIAYGMVEKLAYPKIQTLTFHCGSAI